MSSNETLTNEMKEWLHANRAAFEYYVVNRLFHDESFRTSALAMLEHSDFTDDTLAAIVGAMLSAKEVMQALPDISLPVPPTWEDLSTYAEMSNSQNDIYDDDDIPVIAARANELHATKFDDQWYLIDSFFKGWLTDSRARIYARQAQLAPVIDATALADKLRRDAEAASKVVYNEEDDDWNEALYGTSDKMIQRRSTGIRALDECLGGGLGEGECGLIFAGSGGGKTIACAQIAAHELSTKDGYPLIIATEMRPIVYLVRMVCNVCNIKIKELRNCRNVSQIRGKVMSLSPGKLNTLETLVELFKTRMRVEKVDDVAGLSGSELLRSCTNRFEDIVGHTPTSIHFDWLGDIADSGGPMSSAERAAAWEHAAASMVTFAEQSNIPTVVYAQAVSSAELKHILTQGDVAISKGINKKMFWSLGITNLIDKTAAAEALKTGESLSNMTLDQQRFCLAKARNGEGSSLAVLREFDYQRFVSLS